MLAINIPADGLFLAVGHRINGDFSEESCRRAISEYIGRFLEADPDILLLNVCYRRALTPSCVLDSYLYDIEVDETGLPKKDASGNIIKHPSPTTDRVSKYFMSFFLCARVLLEKGIDLYQMAIDCIRKTGTRVLLSVRMNDAHYTDNAAINSPFATGECGRRSLGGEGVYLDFSQEAVQSRYYAYIEELLATYQVDGIEMDWLRYPTVLPAARRAEYGILDGYMKRVRALLDRFDENLSLAVRLLPSEEENLACGFDAAAWIADGSVDMLTLENFYIPTNFELPFAAWRARIAQRNAAQNPYTLFGGSDWAVSCTAHYNIAMTPALVRGFADACHCAGADGVYLFNFFEEEDTSSYEFVSDGAGARLENCFSSRIRAAKETAALPRRYVHIAGTNKRYPIPLAPGQSYSFAQAFGAPCTQCHIAIGCDQDLPASVTVNGSSVTSQEKEPIFEGFAFVSEDIVGRDNDFVYARTQLAPAVFVSGLSGVPEDGILHINIKNESSEPLLVRWLEVICE